MGIKLLSFVSKSTFDNDEHFEKKYEMFVKNVTAFYACGKLTFL